MVAIITDRFKKQILNDLFTDVVDSAATYYIAIGRSQDWNAQDAAPTPINTPRTIRDFRVNMQAMKKGEDVSYVIPRYNWSSGTIYSGYDDDIEGYPSNAYFVMTDELAVFICLQQGRDAQGNAGGGGNGNTSGGSGGSNGAAIRRTSGFNVTINNSGTIAGSTSATGVS